jgi:hypothetical protein
LTTAAEKFINLSEDERGQSLLEFLLMFPMLLALVVVLVRVNTAIQISIVNQQYARAQALFIAYNSPQFPRLDSRMANLVKKEYSQMIIGVSENAPPSREDGGGKYNPKAASQNVARRKVAEGEDAEGDLRALVRIRDTVTICTQSNFVNGQQGLVPLPIYGGPALNEGSRQQFCNHPAGLKYVSGDSS